MALISRIDSPTIFYEFNQFYFFSIYFMLLYHSVIINPIKLSYKSFSKKLIKSKDKNFYPQTVLFWICICIHQFKLDSKIRLWNIQEKLNKSKDKNFYTQISIFKSIIWINSIFSVRPFCEKISFFKKLKRWKSLFIYTILYTSIESISCVHH